MTVYFVFIFHLLINLGFMLLCQPVAADVSDVEVAIIQKEYREARTLAEEFLSSDKGSRAENQRAYYFIGLSQLYLEEYQEARATFEKILQDKAGPDIKIKAQLGVIDTYNLSGDFQLALNESFRLLEQNPRSEYRGSIYLKIARAQLRLANWAEARKYLNKIVKEFPQSFEQQIAKQLLEEKQYFSVQVGSFLDSQRAKELVTELQQNEQYAYIVETLDQAGQTFYRVRIGQFSRLDQAQDMEKSLSQNGYPTRIYP